MMTMMTMTTNTASLVESRVLPTPFGVGYGMMILSQRTNTKKEPKSIVNTIMRD